MAVIEITNRIILTYHSLIFRNLRDFPFGSIKPETPLFADLAIKTPSSTTTYSSSYYYLWTFFCRASKKSRRAIKRKR